MQLSVSLSTQVLIQPMFMSNYLLKKLAKNKVALLWKILLMSKSLHFYSIYLLVSKLNCMALYATTKDESTKIPISFMLHDLKQNSLILTDICGQKLIDTQILLWYLPQINIKIENKTIAYFKWKTKLHFILKTGSARKLGQSSICHYPRSSAHWGYFRQS